MFEKTDNFVLCLCYLSPKPFLRFGIFNALHLSWLLNEIEKETKRQMLQYGLKGIISICLYLSVKTVQISPRARAVAGSTGPRRSVESRGRALCDDDR